MSQDLAAILREWDFDPRRVTARWVEGDDARIKIQLRVDLGVFQMEIQHRPDGRRPHGCASLLQYYTTRERTAPPNAPELQLDEPACAALQQEMLQYYYRYIALFALRHFDGVIRDTAHNLDIIRYIARHTPEELSHVALPFFPFVKMMNARARAEKALDARQFEEAGAALDAACEEIEAFAARYDLPAAAIAPPLATLRELRDGIQKRKPYTAADRLREELDRAIAAENYERAALLRDRLQALLTPARPDDEARP
ncbi:MAG: UvrB/UvrC motif-containing protein [Kiritimatiellaeota bacterium]|nr:UvrB/UvrC motif-containing protein [Kiritimatiellota bacterium]